MRLRKNLKYLVTLGTAATALSMGLVMATSSGSGASSNSVLTLAESPGATPQYIFPYMSCAVFSVANINAFDYEMYRPLYWFGQGESAAVVPKLSLANQPTFSNGNRTITVDMKGWKFADGQTINAQSVKFFLNMYHAVPTDYCGYNPGFGIISQVKNVTASGNKLTIDMTASMNPYWFLYNGLSQITPMADSWDITAPGKSSTCATGAFGAKATDTACTAVYNYLNGQSKKSTTFTSALWQNAISGPWKLTNFDNLGDVTFVPNKKYSGPQKAQIQTVKEVPFTSTTAEQNALRSGTITMGYVDNGVLTANGTVKKPGANWAPIAANYNLEVGPPWSVNYAALNLNPLSKQAVFLKQLYIRQALQSTVDQKTMINKIQKGYGYEQINPMPPVTPSSISGNPSTTNPYPYSPSHAENLLSAHGWKKSGGTLECNRPGNGMTDCGAGIALHQKLALSFLYDTGSPVTQLEVNTEVSEWKSLGIAMTVSSAPFTTVISTCSANSGKWSICWWGAGWIYSPAIYPSGEILFTPKASFNIGDFNSPLVNAETQQTDFGTATLKAFANTTGKLLPDLWEPNDTNNYVAGGIGEVSKKLKSSIGFTPNPLTQFMPEYYHF